MLPKTYLLGAPSDVSNPFGEGMSAHELMKGLRMCNPNLHAPLPDAFDTWFPGKASGMTALWLGEPGKPESRKICAFHLGIIPEFSQVGPGGEIIRRGWRAVLSKVIKARATTKRKVERVFKTTIDTDGTDGTCSRCRIEGKINKASSKGGLCDIHAVTRMAKETALEGKKEKKWLESLSPGKRMELATTSRVMLDIGSRPAAGREKCPPPSPRAQHPEASRST